MCQRPPKVPDGLRHVGEIEVFHESEAKHFTHSYRHVRITGEIEIDLERVTKYPEPGNRRGKLVGRQGENLVGGQGDRIGDEDFLGQTAGKPADAIRGNRPG